MYENMNHCHDFAINRLVGIAEEKQMKPVRVAISLGTVDPSVSIKIGRPTTKRVAPIQFVPPNRKLSKNKLQRNKLAQLLTQFHQTRRLRDHLPQIRPHPSRMASFLLSDGIS